MNNLLRHPKVWQSLPEPVLRQRQAEKLSAYLKDVVLPFSPHYRKLFNAAGLTDRSIRTFDDLQRIPFTSKADLLGCGPREFLLVPDAGQLARRPSTLARALLSGRAAAARELEREFRPVLMTGTTGRASDPIVFLHTARDIENLSMAGCRVMRICGARTDMRMINMFPFAPHLGFWQTHYAGMAYGVFMMSSGGGKVMGTEGNLRLLRKIEPDVLIGVPTFLYHVLHEAAQEGLRCPRLSKIVLGGEKVPDGMRLKLRELAEELSPENVQVIATYGFTEAKMAWTECPAPEGERPSGYHLNPDFGIVEIINPETEERVPDGEGGEVVYTALDARGTVVLRYRMGDVVEGGIVFEPCPHCGRRLPRLVGNVSRNSEVKEMRFDKVKGTLIDFNLLEHLLDNSPHIGAWQLEIRKLHDDPLEVDQLILHVQKVDATREEQIKAELGRRIADQVEVHPNQVVFHTTDEIRRLQGVGMQLKESRVVDHRPPASAAGVRGASAAAASYKVGAGHG